MKGKACVVFGVLMIVLGIASAKTMSAAECKEERRVAVNECKQIIYGSNPTAACCKRMRVTHLQCVCSVVTPKLAALVDVNRLVKMVKHCGRSLPRHYKCGSITFP